MPAVSSLLRSASSTRKKVLAQQDAEAEYEYSLGYKTYNDYREYDRYLEKRAKSTGDPSSALSLQKKRDSAFRGYLSNEVQRQSIGVLEGRQSNTDKYNAMYGLFQTAMANGMYDQAQTLRLQLDSLDKTIQNEAIAAANGAKAAANAQLTAVKDEVSAHEQALKGLGQILEKSGPDGFTKVLEDKSFQSELTSIYPDLAPVFQAGGQIGFFDIANGIMESIKDTYTQAVSQLPPEQAAKAQEALDKINNGETSFKIPGVAENVTLKDIQTQISAARAGGSYFFRGENGQYEKGKLTDYTWDNQGNIAPVFANPYSEGTKDNPYLQNVDNFDQSQVYRRDSNGNYVDDKGKIVATFKDGQILAPGGGEWQNEAQKNDALQKAGVSYETLLKEQGFNTVKKDGKLYVTITEDAKQKMGNIPGLQNGDPVEVVRDGQGNLRFIKTDPSTGKQSLYQGAFDKNGKVNFRQLAPGEQGAISAQSQGDLSVLAESLNKDYSGNAGIESANKSLVNTVEGISQGIGYTHGVLADAEARRRFLTGDQGGVKGQNIAPTTNPALRLNATERAVRRVVTPIANPVRTVGQVNRKLASINPLAQRLGSILAKLRPSAGQRAANSSLEASRQKIQDAQGFKYGVLADPAKRQAFLDSLR